MGLTVSPKTGQQFNRWPCKRLTLQNFGTKEKVSRSLVKTCCVSCAVACKLYLLSLQFLRSNTFFPYWNDLRLTLICFKSQSHFKPRPKYRILVPSLKGSFENFLHEHPRDKNANEKEKILQYKPFPFV